MLNIPSSSANSLAVSWQGAFAFPNPALLYWNATVGLPRTPQVLPPCSKQGGRAQTGQKDLRVLQVVKIPPLHQVQKTKVLKCPLFWGHTLFCQFRCCRVLVAGICTDRGLVPAQLCWKQQAQGAFLLSSTKLSTSYLLWAALHRYPNPGDPNLHAHSYMEGAVPNDLETSFILQHLLLDSFVSCLLYSPVFCFCLIL